MSSDRKHPLTPGVHGEKRPYVCSAGYLHNFEQGRVECPYCGRGAYSHMHQGLVTWELAHAQCCKVRKVRVAEAE